MSNSTRAERRPALLFDLDGTLVDSIDLIVSSAEHAFASCGRTMPARAEWVSLIGTPLSKQMRLYAESDEECDRLLGAYRTFQREHHDRMTRAYDGTLETVRALHEAGHPTAVVTSKIDELARRALKLVDLESLFDVIVAVEHTTKHKPDPEPVLFALDRLGVAAANAMFIGDSPHDVRAGNAAGVTTVAALWGPFDRPTLEAARPAELIASIRELPGVIERFRATSDERRATGEPRDAIRG